MSGGIREASSAWAETSAATSPASSNASKERRVAVPDIAQDLVRPVGLLGHDTNPVARLGGHLTFGGRQVDGVAPLAGQEIAVRDHRFDDVLHRDVTRGEELLEERAHGLLAGDHRLIRRHDGRALVGIESQHGVGVGCVHSRVPALGKLDHQLFW
jgi:hypothetical protein